MHATAHPTSAVREASRFRSPPRVRVLADAYHAGEALDLVEALEGKMPAAALDSWVRPCRLLQVQGDHLRIAAPNKYTRDWLYQHHADALQSAARAVLGGNPRVSVEVDREPAPPIPASVEDALPTTTGLSTRYTFESFVVGNSNQFAQAACQAVAELPSRAYNPLFIYGGVGLGKTHLLHAVGQRIAKLYPQLRALYLSSERFTNDLINAIRYDRTAEFRAKYRTIDLLLVRNALLTAEHPNAELGRRRALVRVAGAAKHDGRSGGAHGRQPTAALRRDVAQ